MQLYQDSCEGDDKSWDDTEGGDVSSWAATRLHWQLHQTPTWKRHDWFTAIIRNEGRTVKQ